ncbi:DNA polymerase III subunit delta' [Paucidesulfovibrio longus]|uniref:DNA polymerase III subunit delta' n=1 Tax=Paucidesulfovibrio longus TaxID=889 RepID=UPI0003B4AC7D|nr:DNA polymerase III subunit delta' [Paucidesulfovibrio longus]
MSTGAEHHALVRRQERVAGLLRKLALESPSGPPQSLVLEGGSDDERRALALHYAALLNCTDPDHAAKPCLTCPPCRQILEKVFNDLLFIDQTYYEDGKSQLSVSAVRALRPTWGQPPRGNGWRVTVFPNVRDMSADVSNSLLKSLEEPRPGNAFVLLTPQRERLLETLISRSWVLTLAWPDAAPPDPEALEWARAMIDFWRTGRDWYARTMGKPDAALAENILLVLQAALVGALSGKHEIPLARELSPLGPARLRRFDLALDKARTALAARPSPVNPSLVLDWLATRMI